MLVEEIAVTVKFVGDRKGTEMKKKELSDLILSRQTLPVFGLVAINSTRSFNCFSLQY